MTLTVKDVMTSQVIAVRKGAPFKQMAERLRTHHVSAFPVLDDDLGIISRADVLAVYSRPDEEIRKEIRDEVIPNGFPAGPASITVTVQDGIVTLEGEPETAPAGRDIVSRARHIQGVVAVRDRLSYPPPELPVSPGPLF